MSVEALLGDLLGRLGIRGVSTVALLAIVSVVVWSSRARKAGYVLGSGLATVRWTALAIGVLAVGGVVSLNPGRAVDLAMQGFDLGGRAIQFLLEVPGWFA